MSLTIDQIESVFMKLPKKIISKLNKTVQSLTLSGLADADEYFTFYRAQKEKLNTLGYSMKKNEYEGVWQLNKWANVSTTSTTITSTVGEIERKEQTIQMQEPILRKLLSFQVPLVSHLTSVLSTNQCALDASEMGVGKTYIAIGTALTLNLQMFIICPKSAIAGWKKALTHFNTTALGVVNYDLLRSGKYFGISKTGKETHVNCPYIDVVSNPNKGKYEPKYVNTWTLPVNTLIIFDEAHKTKNFQTQNAQLLYSLANQVKETQKILLLSATIAENPLKMKAIGLGLKLFEKPEYFYSWASRYGCQKFQVSRFVSAWQYRGVSQDLINLHHDIFPNRGNRVKKTDLPNFPTNQILAEPININSNAVKLEKKYSEAKAKLKNWAKATAEERETLASKGENPLSINTHLRMASEALKTPAVIEWAEDLMEEGYSVVIFCNYTETLHAIADALKTNCVYHGGNTNIRDQNVEKFQRNESNVIVLNTSAGGQTISLHDLHGNHPRVSLIFPTYSAQDLVQATGRIHRAGSQTPAMQYIVFASDTIEEQVCERVKTKLDNLMYLNDAELDPSIEI